MRVLVVDDSSTMRRIIVNTLKKLGHEDTVEAGDGKEALRALAAGVPDVIVTDWNMPEMNGPQFVEAVPVAAGAGQDAGADGDHAGGQGGRDRRSAGRRQRLLDQAVHAGSPEEEDRQPHEEAVSTAAAKTVATDAPVVEVMVTQLVAVTRDIYATMLDKTVEFGEPTYAGPQPTANVVATVGFAGTLSGYVSLCVSTKPRSRSRRRSSAASADEAPAHVRDAAGEMANMIAGSVRTAMPDRGETLGISTPIVTVGTDFSTAALRDVSQAVCPFRVGPHNMFVYLVLQAARAARRRG